MSLMSLHCNNLLLFFFGFGYIFPGSHHVERGQMTGANPHFTRLNKHFFVDLSGINYFIRLLVCLFGLVSFYSVMQKL